MRHFEQQVDLRATPSELFEYLDDPRVLGAHMSKGTLMMAGGSMRYKLDAGAGREIGSVTRMEGQVLGLPLAVVEEITERQPPFRKIWETTGAQRMIVIASYRLGYEIQRSAQGSNLRVFIDYTLPDRFPGRLMGFLLGPIYARWCVSRMIEGALHRFASGPPG